ncbi:MAG: phosphate signaling complex protein PhoU [Hormoscilla sp. GM102CHS1]|nr:phosphate signaling complex protein PhoU [Hormoscilla sp. GM102CHS1]
MDAPVPGPRVITRTSLARQLRSLQGDVLRMGSLVEKSCWLARKAICDRDLAAAKEIAVQDKQIDRFYRQIELNCVSTMALQAPVTQDLRLISALMQLVRDLERIGDYAKDLGEIAVKLFAYPPHKCMGKIQVMLDRTQAMLAMSLRALSDLDAQAGLEVKVKDDWVDSDYLIIYNELANQKDLQGVVEPTMLLVLVIRHLERMADHATNIGQRVAYIDTGQRY